MKLLKVGTAIEWKPAVPSRGVIVRATMNNEGTELQYLIAYKGDDGEIHQRHFSSEEITEMEGDGAVALKQEMQEPLVKLLTPEKSKD